MLILAKTSRRRSGLCAALLAVGTILSLTTASQAQSQQASFGLIGA